MHVNITLLKRTLNINIETRNLIILSVLSNKDEKWCQTNNKKYMDMAVLS